MNGSKKAVGSRLSMKQTRNQTSRWIHSAVHMHNSNKLARSSDDHEITFFDFTTMQPHIRLDLQDSIAHRYLYTKIHIMFNF